MRFGVAGGTCFRCRLFLWLRRGRLFRHWRGDGHLSRSRGTQAGACQQQVLSPALLCTLPHVVLGQCSLCNQEMLHTSTQMCSSSECVDVGRVRKSTHLRQFRGHIQGGPLVLGPLRHHEAGMGPVSSPRARPMLRDTICYSKSCADTGLADVEDQVVDLLILRKLCSLVLSPQNIVVWQFSVRHNSQQSSSFVCYVCSKSYSPKSYS